MTGSEGELIDRSIENSLRAIDTGLDQLDDDIDRLSEFQRELDSFEPQSVKNSQNMFQTTRPKTDTEKVMEIYSSIVFSDHGVSDKVKVCAENFGISYEAADFLKPLLVVGELPANDVVQKIKYLDGKNPLSEDLLDNYRDFAEFAKGLGKAVKEDFQVEIDSLENYRNKIEDLENQILELNEKYLTPMDINSAIYVERNLSDIQDEIDHLRNIREHELRRRTDILDDYFEENLEFYYSDEEIEKPVLEDLEELRSQAEQAYDSIRVA